MVSGSRVTAHSSSVSLTMIPYSIDEARASVHETLEQLLAEAGVRKDDVIRVSGPSGLASLLWLSRRGYQQVGYIRPGASADTDADALLISQPCDMEVLSRVLRHGPHMRRGGVLIVQTLGPASPVHRLLAGYGFRIERCLAGRHRAVHVARLAGAREYLEAA
jgi:hypothetical protein